MIRLCDGRDDSSSAAREDGVAAHQTQQGGRAEVKEPRVSSLCCAYLDSSDRFKPRSPSQNDVVSLSFTGFVVVIQLILEELDQ